MVEIANTMAKMMPTLIPTIVKAVMQIIPALIDALPLIMDAGMQMQFALIDGIMAALPQLIQSMPVIIERFLNALIPQLPKIMAYAPKIILALAKGLISAIPTLVSQIPQIVRAIINGLASGISGFVNVGQNMARGLWNGIKGLKDWVISKVKGMGNEIVKSLKKTLGIHSPSTEFALIGKFSVLGYTEALDKMSKDVDKQVANTFGLNPQLTGSMQNTFSPNVQVYNNVNVEQDPLGQMVSSIKTFSGGAKNDYNYGSGI
jgi:phage-related protein